MPSRAIEVKIPASPIQTDKSLPAAMPGPASTASTTIWPWLLTFGKPNSENMTPAGMPGTWSPVVLRTSKAPIGPPKIAEATAALPSGSAQFGEKRNLIIAEIGPLNIVKEEAAGCGLITLARDLEQIAG